MKSLFLYEVESTTAAAVVVSIPSPVVAGLGAEVLVRDKSDGTNTVTVTPVAGTIEGEASAVVAGALRLMSDGAQWMDIGGASGPVDTVTGDPLATVTGEVVQVTSTNGAVQISATGNNIEATAVDGAFIATATNGDNGGIVLAAGGSPSPSPDSVQLVSSGATIRATGDFAVLAAVQIVEHNGAGATQLAHIAAVTDEASVVAAFNLLRTYLIARGTMAAS